MLYEFGILSLAGWCIFAVVAYAYAHVLGTPANLYAVGSPALKKLALIGAYGAGCVLERVGGSIGLALKLRAALEERANSAKAKTVNKAAVAAAADVVAAVPRRPRIRPANEGTPSPQNAPEL